MAIYAHKPRRIDWEKSNEWAIAGLGSWGLGAAGIQLFDLLNRQTRRAHRLGVTTLGHDERHDKTLPSESINVTGPEYTHFQTPVAVNFFDFDGSFVRVTELNVGLHSWSVLTFFETAAVMLLGPGLNVPGGGSGRGPAEILFGTGQRKADEGHRIHPPPRAGAMQRRGA